MLDSLVEGLPTDAKARIVARAEGIPLYGIETIRSLLDKGVLERDPDGTLHLPRATGQKDALAKLGELATPPGLTALISSRLDGLGPDERRLVKECSVLGASFPRQAVEAVSDIDQGLLSDLLGSLVRKEILTVRADKLSPERGQYAFTQSLIGSVAYDTLTRTEKKQRHLRTAEHLRAAFPDKGAEVAEVIAAHLDDAYKAAGDDPDATELKVRAATAHVAAGERAESIGGPEAAEASYLRAAELTDDERDETALLERAGQMAHLAGWNERALAHFERAVATHNRTASADATRAFEAARVTARLGSSLSALGRGEEAISRIQDALTSLEGADGPPAVLAELLARLGAALVYSGHNEEATAPVEEALTLAQHHELTEPLALALNARALLLSHAGRAEEARGLFELLATLARRHGIARSEILAEGNLADLSMIRDLPGAKEHARAALQLAQRWGQRDREALGASNLMYILMMEGAFAEALQLGTELLKTGGEDRPGAGWLGHALSVLEALCGEIEAAREHLSLCSSWAESDDVQSRAAYAAAEATVALASGDSRQGLDAAMRALDEATTGRLPFAHENVRIAYLVAIEAAVELGELNQVDSLITLLADRPKGEVPPFLRAQVRRARALVAIARHADEEVEEHLSGAEATFTELHYPYFLARTQLDRAEWLAGRGRLDELRELGEQVARTFEEVGAAPMLAWAKRLLEAAELGPIGTAGSTAKS